MQKILSTICAIALVATSALAATKTHPDLEKLKLYRSYYYIQLESKTAHQFEVWFQYKDKQTGYLDWHVFQAAANQGDNTEQIQQQDYLSTHQMYAGGPQPQPNYTPVPSELNALEEGLKKAVRRNHADLDITDIQVHYLGKAARVLAHEIIPLSTNADPEKRMAVKGGRFYFVDLSSGKIKETPTGSLAIGGLDLDSYVAGNKVTNPIWVDFILPPQIEGSSLFEVDFRSNAAPIYVKTKRKLMTQIVATARLLESGASFDPSIDKVLKRQDPTLLPSHLKQTLQFKVTVLGRALDFKNQLDRSFEFLIPTTKTFFSLTKKDSVTGITFTLASDFSVEKPQLTLTAVAADGKSQQLRINAEERFEFLQDGPRIALNGGFYLEYTGASMSFPGNGQYTGFDIYPGSDIFPSLFTGL